MSDEKPTARAMNLRGRDGGANPEMDDLASLRGSRGGSSRSYVVTSPSSARSHRSEGSTSDLSEPGCESSPKPKSTRGDDESSRSGSPVSPSTTTYERLEGAPGVETDHREPPDAPPSRPFALLTHHNNAEAYGDLSEQAYSLDETCRRMPIATLPISSAAGFPAKTSALPGSDAGSPANAPACSSSSPGSQMSFDHAGSSLRTSLGSSPLPTAETWESFSQRWPTSGMAWRGGFSTLVSSEFPNAGVECSLSDILVGNPSPRYALSARAATGILRRAAARGRELPPELEEALTSLAASQPATSASTEKRRHSS